MEIKLIRAKGDGVAAIKKNQMGNWKNHAPIKEWKKGITREQIQRWAKTQGHKIVSQSDGLFPPDKGKASITIGPLTFAVKNLKVTKL